jgi:hypothetical protein
MANEAAPLINAGALAQHSRKLIRLKSLSLSLPESIPKRNHFQLISFRDGDAHTSSPQNIFETFSNPIGSIDRSIDDPEDP